VFIYLFTTTHRYFFKYVWCNRLANHFYLHGLSTSAFCLYRLMMIFKKLFLSSSSGAPCTNESQSVQRSTTRVPFISGNERVLNKLLVIFRLQCFWFFIDENRTFGDEKPPVPAITDDLTDGLAMKAARPRKARPPPKFDMAAELLMSGGREREVKLNNGGGYLAAADDGSEADRLMQRLKAL
jgi:hypothetical protein